MSPKWHLHFRDKRILVQMKLDAITWNVFCQTQIFQYKPTLNTRPFRMTLVSVSHIMLTPQCPILEQHVQLSPPRKQN